MFFHIFAFFSVFIEVTRRWLELPIQKRKRCVIARDKYFSLLSKIYEANIAFTQYICNHFFIHKKKYNFAFPRTLEYKKKKEIEILEFKTSKQNFSFFSLWRKKSVLSYVWIALIFVFFPSLSLALSLSAYLQVRKLHSCDYDAVKS